jgi:hypothetical protein
MLKSVFLVLTLLCLGWGPPVLADEAAAKPDNSRVDVLARFSPEQREKLLAGEAIYEYVINDGDSAAPKGYGSASVLIKAPVDQCFKSFCEIDKHPLYFPHKTVSRVVEWKGSDAYVYKEMEFPLKTMRYYVWYKIDPVEHRVDFNLDKEHTSDIRDSAGFFHFIEVDPQTTLFDYGLTKADPGIRVPKFIQKYLTSQDLPRVVSNYKKWLESGGTWKK